MIRPIAVVTAIAAVLLAAVVFWLARDPGRVGESSAAPVTEPAPAVADGSEPDAASAAGARETDTPAAEPAAPAPPPGFCARDFSDLDARRADVPDLAAAGGLVYIFEREARLDDPYGCADFYLEQGLDVDAVDPRPDTAPITGLFYAIQRNDPKMVRFTLDHGADPRRRAGENDIRATGYAYSLAMQDQRIDRNEVIAILDEALLQRQRSGN